jgi:hypothetical protein
LPSIKNEIWARMSSNATYEEACHAALEAENVCINKELAEDKGLTAVVAGISLHGEQQDARIKKQEAEIELLKNNLKALTISNNLSQGMDSKPMLIAAVTEERPRSRIRFERSPSANREDRSNSRNRIGYEDRSRSTSPYQDRYRKDLKEKIPERGSNINFRKPEEKRYNFDSNRSQRYPQTDLNRGRERNYNWRDRSQSSSRNQSWDRKSTRFTNIRPRFENQVQNNRFRPTERRSFNTNPRRDSYQNNRYPVALRSPFGSSEQITSNTNNNNCFFCGKPGHQIKECRLKLRNQQRGRTITFNR